MARSAVVARTGSCSMSAKWYDLKRFGHFLFEGQPSSNEGRKREKLRGLDDVE